MGQLSGAPSLAGCGQVGMHAALQINPYYGKTSEEGLAAHFDAVLEEGPAIIYNVPGRTGQDIPDAVVQRLASNPNLLGVKECTGNDRIQVGPEPADANYYACIYCFHRYQPIIGRPITRSTNPTQKCAPVLMKALIFDALD